MLVLTRRTKDKVSFPQVGITIHFIRVQSGQVKVGVDAPRDIAIIRDDEEEAGVGEATAEMVRRQIAHLPQETRHGIRNELHQISVGLHLYKELLNAGLTNEANETFKSMQDALDRLDSNEVLQRPGHHRSNDASSNRIALIEDEANERQMLAEFLRLKGYQIEEFADGRAAIEYFAENELPDLVLVDMHMPGFDGKQTVTAMRDKERFQGVPIFAISGTSPDDNGLPMGNRGVDRWFPKPLSVQTLMSAIAQTIVQPDAVQSCPK